MDDERTTQSVCLAVKLIDGFAARYSTENGIVYKAAPLLGSYTVYLKEYEIKAKKTMGDFWVFLDIPFDNGTLVVESELYIREEKKVSLIGADPFQGIIMIPNTKYPFPVGTTILQGKVKNNSGVAMQGITVEVPQEQQAARTDQNGEYVIGFSPRLSEEDVMMEGQKKYIRTVDGKILTIQLLRDGSLLKMENVPEGIELDVVTTHDFLL